MIKKNTYTTKILLALIAIFPIQSFTMDVEKKYEKLQILMIEPAKNKKSAWDIALTLLSSDNKAAKKYAHQCLQNLENIQHNQEAVFSKGDFISSEAELQAILHKFSIESKPEKAYSFKTFLNQGSTRKLLNDFKRYTTTNTAFHAGNLFQHSVWSTLATLRWWDKKDEWVEGIDNKYQALTIIAGLLHDIGKGGDRKFKYHTKSGHERKGFDYLMGAKTYKLKSGNDFNFSLLLDQHKFTPQHKKILAILVDMHGKFGSLLKRINEKPDKQCQTYLDILRKSCKNADYTDGLVDDQLLRMTILITAADVAGARRIRYYPKEIRPPYEVHETKQNAFHKFKYSTTGLYARRKLIAYFKPKLPPRS